MNKLIAILYILYFVSYMMGCATKSDYEIRLFMDKEDGEVNGYIRIDGEKHLIKAEYE